MSETTSSALLKVLGSEAEGTAELLSIVDKLFDCLNVHNLTEAKHKRKPFRSPYRCGTDWRLKVSNSKTIKDYILYNILLASLATMDYAFPMYSVRT